MPHSIASASELLVKNLPLIKNSMRGNGVLDLACGKGRNGLYLLQNSIPVMFVDKDEVAIESVVQSIKCLKQENLNNKNSMADAKCWKMNLEQVEVRPLRGQCFDTVLVFNYLHRPLMPEIKQIIAKAGLIFYETFTVQQPKYGRPTNPDYLLRKNELLEVFNDWEVINYFEGLKSSPDRAIASLIARKN